MNRSPRKTGKLLPPKSIACESNLQQLRIHKVPMGTTYTVACSSLSPYTDAGVNATFNGDTGVKAVNIAPGLTVETRVVGSELFGQGSATRMLSAFESLAVLSAGLRGNARGHHLADS